MNKFYTINELAAAKAQMPITNYIWEGVPQNSVGLIVGPSKSGKTIISENLGMCIAANTPDFLGKPISPNSGPVLFISLEEYWVHRIGRNIDQQSALDADLSSSYLVMKDELSQYIETDANWSQLETFIKESEAKVVFIDSLSRLYVGQIEDSATAQKLMSRIRGMISRLNITLFIVHHTPKMGAGPISMENIAGSRFISQEVDFCFGVNRTNDGARVFNVVFFRYGAEPENSNIIFKINEHKWIEPQNNSAYLMESSDDGRVDNENSERILEYIMETGQDEYSSKQLLETFVDSGKMSKPTMYSSMKKLINEGYLIKPDKGVYIVAQ